MGDRWRFSKKKNIKEILHIFDPDRKPPINDILKFFGYEGATSLVTDSSRASQLNPAATPSFSQPIYTGNPDNGGLASDDLANGGVDTHTSIQNSAVQLFPHVTSEMWNPVMSEFDADYLNYNITVPDYTLGSAAVLPQGSNSLSALTALSAKDSSPLYEDEEDFAEVGYDEFGMDFLFQ
jgi:hypothetical protein